MFSLDTSHLMQRMDGTKQVVEPQILWTRQLGSLTTDSDANDYRSYVEAADRVTQFAPQLSGYYPIAPGDYVGRRPDCWSAAAGV